MSSTTLSETETLLSPTTSIPAQADGGKDIPTHIKSFRRNVTIFKTLSGLGLAGALGLEITCLIESFISHVWVGGKVKYTGWERGINITGVTLTTLAATLFMISLLRRPKFTRDGAKNIALHKTLTELLFVIFLALLLIHAVPTVLFTFVTHTAPPRIYPVPFLPYIRTGLEGFTLLMIGSMRRGPKLHYTPLKMGTGFGITEEHKPAASQQKAYGSISPNSDDAARVYKRDDLEPNILDRPNCSILNFISLGFIAGLLRKSMRLEKLELSDLPHLAEQVRKSGYRDALGDEKGKIQLDEDAQPIKRAPEIVTSWKLVKAVWKGRGYVVVSNALFEAVSNLIGLAQLMALRELIDSFDDPVGTDKSYAYMMCGLLLVGQVSEVFVSAVCWVRENYLLHLPVRMTLASVLFSKILRSTDAKTMEAHNVDNDDEENSGKGRSQVMNLLTIDTGEVASLGIHVWSITNSIVNLSIGFWLLYSMLGVSALVGVGCIPILSSFTSIIAKVIYYCDKSLARARDARTGAVKEFLAGIKVIKLNAFEEYYLRNIRRLREKEVRWRRYRFHLGTLWNVTADQLPIISILVTFVFHTKVMHRPLTASTAFVALTVFNRVRGSLIQLPATLQALLQAKVSMDRLTTYLNQPEIDPVLDESDGRVVCENATIAWPSMDAPAVDVVDEGGVQPFRLKDVDLEVPMGKFTLVCGPLGSGKTLFLRALLGEARVVDGSIVAPRTVPDAVPLNGGDIVRNWTNTMWLTNSVAYSPQQAFIRHGTIKDNILFGQPLWKDRYKEALRQAALISDLAIMPDGDMTEVGEHGTNLSGGQKARINLARCIYSRAKTVYLDDILSAVDAHTSQHIFKECFQGSLLRDRTVILVTHHVQLCLPAAHFLIALKDGGVEQACPASEASIKDIPLAPDSSADEGPSVLPETDFDDEGAEEEVKQAGRQIYKAEHVAAGRVDRSHYRLILSAVGGWGYWTIFVAIYCVTRLADIGQSLVLERWAADEDPNHLDQNLIAYVSFVTAGVVLGAFRWLWLYGIGNVGFVNSAARKMHENLLVNIAAAPLGWFERTPTGRLMNIFGQDISRIDGFISDDVGRTVSTSLEVFSSLFIVCLQAPILTVFILFFSIPFYWLSGVLGKLRAELRRLNATAGSPLITLYHDAIDGVVMIRAFGSNELMQASMLALINRERNATIADWIVFNWVRAMIQTITSFIVAGTGFALVGSSLSSAQAGFILSFAITASSGLFGLLERYSSLEQTFVGAERLAHYIQDPPKESTEGITPPSSWPSEGRIKIKDLCVRYADDLPDVLHDVSFDVEPGMRVGLVGATGSGKSTMALSLFRSIEPHAGTIEIDGLDITQVALGHLRKRLNMVAQDGSLGSGTLRDALDITGTRDDQEIYEALRRVHLIPAGASREDLKDNPFADLDTFVAIEGANFSQGQRQLLCLARALLKKSNILVMDEATSSVDFEMDAKITQTIKECFAGTTMLVIAHRLATIMHYDRVLVLEKGRVLEFGRPVDLMQKSDSAFHSLCMAQGKEEYEMLLAMARTE